MTLSLLALPDGAPIRVATVPMIRSFALPGRDAVYLGEPGAKPWTTTITRVDPDTGRRRQLATLDKVSWGGATLSPDERFLLVSAINSWGTDLMLVELVR